MKQNEVCLNIHGYIFPRERIQISTSPRKRYIQQSLDQVILRPLDHGYSCIFWAIMLDNTHSHNCQQRKSRPALVSRLAIEISLGRCDWIIHYPWDLTQSPAFSPPPHTHSGYWADITCSREPTMSNLISKNYQVWSKELAINNKDTGKCQRFRSEPVTMARPLFGWFLITHTTEQYGNNWHLNYVESSNSWTWYVALFI